MSSEAFRNTRIAKVLSRRIEDSTPGVFAYTNAIGVEVERSQKEERVPDVLVISEDCWAMLDDDAHVITLDMPAPILVVEVGSPSSVKDDLENSGLIFYFWKSP